jgi:2-polyprenyl-3-methyl-5-hydroxy-6-metoxy-1,4-benzoquinol methylase
MSGTREPQYDVCLELRERKGLASLGLMTNYLWQHDPRHLLFLLARYKFVAKMLSGCERVLEVGCGDGMGARLVQQEVPSVTVTDFDPVFIRDVEARQDPEWRLETKIQDFLAAPLEPVFDAAYALDVLEHVRAEDEERFLRNLAGSLRGSGVVIVGMPSLASQVHASPPSRAGHVNCKDAAGLKAVMSAHFEHVFVFSMNDEVVHTGFYPMAQYLLALCCARRKPSA